MRTKRFSLVVLASGLAAHAATISTNVQQASYGVGDLIPLGVSILRVSDLYAFQFDLSFDPTVLYAQSVMEGGYFLFNGVSFSPGLIDNTSGSISFVADTLSGLGPGFSGDGALATITFIAIGPGSASVSPVNVVTLDSKLSEITATTSTALVYVSGAQPTPEPNLLVLMGLLILGMMAATQAIKSKIVKLKFLIASSYSSARKA